MGTARSRRRGRRLKPSPALLAPAALAAAILATAALSVAVGRPVAALSTTTVASIQSKTTSRATSKPPTTAKTPGWRVIAKVGSFSEYVTGTLTADSPKVSWSVWTGQGFTAVDRWNGTAWKQVAVPTALIPYVRSAIAFDGYPDNNFWLFDSYRPTEAVRYTGSTWALQKIPSWALRKQSGGGGYDVTAAVLGPSDVWVFSLGAGAYAAHDNGHAWDKIKLPEAPVTVDADASNDIWALGANELMHWSASSDGWHAIKFPLLPPGELPAGTVNYQDLSVYNPDDLWLVGQVTATAGPLSNTWFVQHWNGKSWEFYDGPTNFVGSVAPDGSGGLWADGINANPSGFWLLYHLSGGHWTNVSLPSGVWPQSPLTLTGIRGSKSVWATAQSISAQGGKALILKYGV
jgi:hypothetical protein